MDPVLLETISRYRSHKALQLFAYLRSYHANYEAIEKQIPSSGVIVDVGCGHGMFANYLGLKSSARSVIGLEINQRKLSNAPRGVPNVLFENKPLEAFEKKSADAVIFYHVLHHLSGYDHQEKLIETALSVLNPRGKLIIVEIEKRPRWKFILCWFVDHALYLGDRIYFRFKEDMLNLLKNKFRLNVSHFMCDRQSPLPHIAYIATL